MIILWPAKCRVVVKLDTGTGLVVTKNVYFPLLTHTNQLLLVTLCHTPAVIGNSKVGRDADADGRRRRKDRQT